METLINLTILIALITLLLLSFYNAYKNATDPKYNANKCGGAVGRFVYGFFKGLSLYFIGMVFVFCLLAVCVMALIAIGSGIYELVSALI